MFFLKEFPNFIEPGICKSILEEHRDRLKPSNTGIDQKFKGSDTGRTSQTAIPLLDFGPLKYVQQRVYELTSLPQENQENPSIINYQKGGYYNAHFDCFDESDKDFEKRIIPNGGQRIYSCLLYLNEDFIGGLTAFPRQKKSIVPETGKLIWWNNTTPDGIRLEESLHAGLPVKKGSKWIMTIWIRLGNTNAS